MSISIVNGYVCFNSCDVKRAETGKNPHDNPGQLDNDPRANKHPSDPASGNQPAVTFGGSLNGTVTANAVSPASAASGSAAATTNPAQPSVNIQA
jgi:hypothetical protein